MQISATPVARVVVERLDSLGAGVFGDNVVCGAADEDTGFSLLCHSHISYLSDIMPSSHWSVRIAPGL